MISSAQRTASATAHIVAGTRFPGSYCASFRAARMLAAISSIISSYKFHPMLIRPNPLSGEDWQQYALRLLALRWPISHDSN